MFPQSPDRHPNVPTIVQVHNLGETGCMSEGTWSSLLDRLEERVPDFVERFLFELHARVLYEPGMVPEQDLAHTAHETMLMIIARLRTGQVVGLEITDALGRRRARQGVPLERLIEAIRLDLRLVWQLLLEIAQPDHTAVLVQNVELLISVVDGYVSDVQRAFLREVAILQRDSRLATEQHLSRLFNAQAPNPALIDEIASGVGVASHDDFEMIMIPNVSEEHRGRVVSGWLAKRDVRAYMFRGWLLLFRPRGPEPSRWPGEFAEVPCVYVQHVEGLRSLPAAARAAADLQTLAAPLDHLVFVEEFWAVGAASHLTTLLPSLPGSTLHALAEIPDEERDRLLRTVRTYLQSGSIKQTATQMGCHRNTVINRFRLFRSRTGLEVTIPAQAALAFVLLSGEDGRLAPRLSR